MMKVLDIREQDWFKEVMMVLPDMTANEMVNQYNYYHPWAESPSHRGNVEMETNQYTRERN